MQIENSYENFIYNIVVIYLENLTHILIVLLLK